MKYFFKIKKQHWVVMSIGLALALGFNNCAKVNFRDHGPILGLSEDLPPTNVEVVSGAIKKQNAQGYGISMTAGHFGAGVELKTNTGHKIFVSEEGQQNANAQTMVIQMRQ